MVIEIPLTRGKKTQLDDADWDLIKDYKWFYAPIYASTNSKKEDGPRRTLFMHCMIMGRMGVDHINGDSLDNRRCNLRPATALQNAHNRRINNNPTGYKGVRLYYNPVKDIPKKYKACICFKYKPIFLGLYDTPEEAALAYNKKATELFGEFAYLNKVPNE